jgi:hypothetical protein
MDGLALLRRAQDAGLRVELAGAALKISGPKQAGPLVKLLAENKAKVLEALRPPAGAAADSEQRTLSRTPSGEPSVYGDVVAKLRSRCPDHIENDRWQQAIQDADSFLAGWGGQAHALGWTAHELFGLHAVPARPAPNYSRLSRYDETGLIWLLQGRSVVALTEVTAAIQGATGRLVYRKHNKPALGPLGDSLDDMGPWA